MTGKPMACSKCTTILKLTLTLSFLFSLSFIPGLLDFNKYMNHLAVCESC